MPVEGPSGAMLAVGLDCLEASAIIVKFREYECMSFSDISMQREYKHTTDSSIGGIEKICDDNVPI